MAMSSACLIHVEVATALAVTSREPRARISRCHRRRYEDRLRRLPKQIQQAGATQADER